MSLLTLPGTAGRRSERTKSRRSWGLSDLVKTSSLLRPPGGRRTVNFVSLLLLVLALNFVGLVMVLSASSVTGLQDVGSSWYYFQRQALWCTVGFVMMAVMMRVDYRFLRRLAVPAVVLSAVLLAALYVPSVGITANGSTRWMGWGPLTLQPSEFAKLAVIVFSANLLARRADRVHDTRQSLRPVLFVAGLLGALVLFQPSQGTAMIIIAIAFVLLFAAGVPLVPLAIWTTALGIAAVWLATAASYRRDRVLAFLDPWEDPLNTGYQTIQSLVGIASGGTTGVGLGAGRAKWGFLPFAHTDFIFTVVAEELGLIGASAIILLFACVGAFGLRVALQAPDRFGTLLAAGITFWIVLQAFINISAAVGMIPISGVPLPFVSLGGSSLVVSMISVGVLLNISRQSRVT